ncbi:acetoacetate decarboxylase family protein [Nocardioides sp. MAHUQ-72]|uniref:acetoacetate decarboxylase family protein n=1 Tax=unclassified Nocardioides TaxID=2615069 RepID=UPI003623255E
MATPEEHARHGPDRGDFYDWSGPRPQRAVGGRLFEMPAFYHRITCFYSVHLADHAAVRDELPSREVEPVRWFDGSAAVQVVALRYDEVTGVVDGRPARLAPYGEVGISALVSRHRWPRGVAMAASDRVRFGGFVLDLPVTTAEARDLGREVFGFPKFVADMDFRDGPGEQAVSLSEEGTPILDLRVRPAGRVVRVRRPWLMYSSLDNRLLETEVPMVGHCRGRKLRPDAELRLGDHPVAERLRRLRVRPEPVAAATYLGLRMVLPAGVPVGSARAHPGHPGRERDRGRLTVDYIGTGPIDQYAPAGGVLHVG